MMNRIKADDAAAQTDLQKYLLNVCYIPIHDLFNCKVVNGVNTIITVNVHDIVSNRILEKSSNQCVSVCLNFIEKLP